ncbi:hypothetical protein LCGC14_0885720 [marine sediment metagenome]|uniref:Uncharacterized protein n=1 Tax=marine sediment metagenome TaxID=412755 RepID=A0A0F9P0R7_9ZZZZ
MTYEVFVFYPKQKILFPIICITKKGELKP